MNQISLFFLLITSVLYPLICRGEEALEPIGSNLSVIDETLLDKAELLDDEHREYLLYLLSRLSEQKLAEQLAIRVLEKKPSDKRSLLVLSSMYLENLASEKLLIIARRLVGYYPDDDQAQYFLAAAHQLNNQDELARDIFKRLKQEQFVNRKFPYETDLASASFESGDWHTAMEAYILLLRHHDLNDELRQDVRDVLDRIYLARLSKLEVRGMWIGFNEGTSRVQSLEYSRQVTKRTRFQVRLESVRTSLKESTIYREQVKTQNVVKVSGETLISRSHELRYWLGGVRSEWMSGIESEHLLDEKNRLIIKMSDGEVSKGSLSIESLNGTENLYSVELKHLLFADLELSGSVYYREHLIQDYQFGSFIGVNWNVHKRIYENRPEFTLNYAGALERYKNKTVNSSLVDPLLNSTGLTVEEKQNLIRGLVSDRLHYHSLFLSLEESLTHQWKIRIRPGVTYFFSNESLEYDVSTGMTFWPRKSIEARVDASYSTGSQISNQSSTRKELDFILSCFF